MDSYKVNIEVDQNDEQTLRDAIIEIARTSTSNKSGAIMFNLNHILTKLEIAFAKEVDGR